jgi:hypothetical protein
VQDWILEENLRPFFHFAAEQVEYDFNDLDWGAVSHGVQATDAEADAWFEYPLVGPRPLTIAVAHDPGSAVVLIRTTGDAEVETTLSAVMSLMQSYALRDPSG